MPWLSVYTQPNEHPLFEINKLTLTDIYTKGVHRVIWCTVDKIPGGDYVILIRVVVVVNIAMGGFVCCDLL